MKSYFDKLLQNRYNIIILVMMLIAVSGLLIGFSKRVDDQLFDLFFKIRGQRQISDKIVFVYLSDQDIQDLGGWPITRDYYGYITHVLTERGARVIGFDFLMDTPSSQYPEFDRVLTDFFESSGNVCLPSIVLSSKETQHNQSARSTKGSIQKGESILFPYRPFKEHAAGIGFSNLGDESTIRKTPLVMTVQDTFLLSYGVELVRLYLGATRSEILDNAIFLYDQNKLIKKIPFDHKGFLRLNHFGGVEHIRSYDFLNLLQMYKESPDSLDFNGCMVVVAATASSLPVVKRTPLSSFLPASLIHLTVAENLIFKNQFHESPSWIVFILSTLILFFYFYVWKNKSIHVALMLLSGCIGGYVAVSYILFVFLKLVVPIFFPVAFLIFVSAILGGIKSGQRRWRVETQRSLLREQISQKREALVEAENRLRELKTRLQTEMDEKQKLSEKTLNLTEERKKAVQSLEKHLRDLEDAVVSEDKIPKSQFPGIIHAPESKMVSVLSLVQKLALDDISVLILGETGTGKELVARAIHEASSRKKAPFIAVNCGALPETLLESELFGHEKGSFTGATARRRGRFELADGGTIFLDEITETAPAFQSHLLRVLQEGTIERLGSEQLVRVNVRVIAATNKDIKDEVHSRRFRSDLFYRLNGFTMKIPPLHERKEDIPVLAVHFIQKYGDKHIASFSEHAMDILLAYSWPGNVRELENVIRRAALMARSENRIRIQASDIPDEIKEIKEEKVPHVSYQSLEEQILEMMRVLKFSRSSISKTAKALGNRDRGTITEYFRGMCFEALVNNDYHIEKAAMHISMTKDKGTVERIAKKIEEYLRNLQLVSNIPIGSIDDTEILPSTFKGLPQKYHPFLIQIIQHFCDE